MKIYNKNTSDITFPSIGGYVTFKGSWNRSGDKDQTAIEGNYGVTEISEQRWQEIVTEFKDVHAIKAGMIFAAKNDLEAASKIADLPKNGNERLKPEKDIENKGGIVKFDSKVK